MAHRSLLPFPPFPPARSTNGHRFVFHSSEVVAEERLYVQNEPGVDPDAKPECFDSSDPSYNNVRGVPSPMAFLMNPAMGVSPVPRPPSRQNSGPGYQNPQLDPRLFHSSSPPTDASIVTFDSRVPTRRSSSSTTPERGYHGERPSSPPNWAESDSETHLATSDISSRLYQAHPQGPGTLEHAQQMYENSRASYSPSSSAGNIPSPPPESRGARQREYWQDAPVSPSRTVRVPFRSSASPEHYHPELLTPKFKRLRAGEVVYWHHLLRRGELPGVCDDDRARASRGFGAISRGRSSSVLDEDRNNRPKAYEADEWDKVTSHQSTGRSHRGMATGSRMWCAR